MFGDEPFTSLTEYGNLLQRIYRRITLLFPRAKVVFLLTTPVAEELTPSQELIRYDRDVVAYNQKAIEVLSPLGVEFLDLYTRAKALPFSCIRDWMHYTPEGAEQLADFILQSLGLDNLPLEDAFEQSPSDNSTYEGETV